MKLVKKGEGQHTDQAPGHFGQWGMTKLVAGKDTQRVTFILSHYLPEGGVEMGAAPGELIYYGVSGSLCVKGKAEEYILEPGGVLYIAPGEERESRVLGTDPATILVIFSPNPK